MNRHRWMTACIIGVILSGCVKRVPVYDEAGKPISESEIGQHQTSKSFALYTIAGGALSFGGSFFLSTLINRGLDKSQGSPELWVATGVGTLAGSIFFASQGSRRDRNNAIEAAKDERKAKAAKQLITEKSKQERVDKELKDLKSLRESQEAEKAKLKEKIKKKKGKNGKNF